MTEPVDLAMSLARIVQQHPDLAAAMATPAATVGDDVAEHARKAAAERDRWLAEKWIRICPRKFLDADVATLEHPPAILATLTSWLDDALAGRAGNLLLLGAVGNGKTFAALGLGRRLHFAGTIVRFAETVALLDALRDAFRPDAGSDPRALQRLAGADVLILDDLGAENTTPWTVERLYVLLNRRYLDCRPTIVTSNMSPEELHDMLGDRCYDRLRDGAIPLRFNGDSRRRPGTVSRAQLTLVQPDQYREAL